MVVVVVVVHQSTAATILGRSTIGETCDERWVRVELNIDRMVVGVS